MGATTKGRWSYACSKAIDEFLAIAYWKEHRVPTVIARLFNTVGPRQTGRYGMVIPNFVAQALTGADIRVFGDGQQSRCFTHVSDAVEALIDLDADARAFVNSSDAWRLQNSIAQRCRNYTLDIVGQMLPSSPGSAVPAWVRQEAHRHPPGAWTGHAWWQDLPLERLSR